MKINFIWCFFEVEGDFSDGYIFFVFLGYYGIYNGGKVWGWRREKKNRVSNLKDDKVMVIIYFDE